MALGVPLAFLPPRVEWEAMAGRHGNGQRHQRDNEAAPLDQAPQAQHWPNAPTGL